MVEGGVWGGGGGGALTKTTAKGIEDKDTEGKGKRNQSQVFDRGGGYREKRGGSGGKKVPLL